VTSKSVTERRWQEAQAWEVALWRDNDRRADRAGLRGLAGRLIYGRTRDLHSRFDDWNHWWALQFEEYGFLPPVVDNYIEVGCGPYTNTRLILRGRSARHVVCSDPHALQYALFKHGWLAQQYRAAAILLDDHPLEECPFAAGAFDVVVVINVLEHVRDADACLRTVTRLVKPGGHLILGEDLSNDEDVRNIPYDTGHPIRLRLDDVEPYLEGYVPLIHKVLPRESGRSPQCNYATLIFAGRRRGSTRVPDAT